MLTSNLRNLASLPVSASFQRHARDIPSSCQRRQVHLHHLGVHVAQSVATRPEQLGNAGPVHRFQQRQQCLLHRLGHLDGLVSAHESKVKAPAVALYPRIPEAQMVVLCRDCHRSHPSIQLGDVCHSQGQSLQHFKMKPLMHSLISRQHDTQHSSVVSFLISFSEVCRRGIWVLFRVENEHCTNVVRFRASREAKLPYKIASQETEPEEDPSDESDDDGSEPTSPKGHHHHRPTSAQMLDGSSPVEPNGMVPPGSDTTTTPAPPNSDPATSPSLTRPRPPPRTATATGAASSADIERGPFSLRRRNQTSTMPPASPGVAADANDSPISRALRRVGTTMLTAHARDYERKRKPEDVLDSGRRGSGSGGAGGAKNGGPVAAIDMENVRDDDYDEEDDDEDQDSDDD